MSGFAATRLGQIAQMMLDEGEARDSAALRTSGEICLRRGVGDGDDDMSKLVEITLCTYAAARGICVTCLPITHAH